MPTKSTKKSVTPKKISGVGASKKTTTTDKTSILRLDTKVAKGRGVLSNKRPKFNLRERRTTRKAQKNKLLTNRHKLTGSFRLFRDSTSLVWQHWRLFGGLTLVYIVLTLTLVGGLGGSLNIDDLRTDLGEELGRFTSSITLFGVLVGSVGSVSTERGAAYQTVVVIVMSLAIIWALRQIMAGEKIGVRDAFYKGLYPLAPFTLVLLAIGLQLIPLLIAGFLYSVVYGGGLAVGPVEIVLWIVPLVLLIAWSGRMVTSSIFALYIVTLPDMRPMAALRSARKLVRFRRWTIIRKLLALLFILLVLGAGLVIPLIMFVPVIVVWLFAVLSMVGFIIAHTYLYNLYRELL